MKLIFRLVRALAVLAFLSLPAIAPGAPDALAPQCDDKGVAEGPEEPEDVDDDGPEVDPEDG